MKREEMATLAQSTAKAVVLPEPGCRVVVIVTDEEGRFVGVGSTTGVADTRSILYCALMGGDMKVHNIRVVREHQKKGPEGSLRVGSDTEGEVVRDGK